MMPGLYFLLFSVFSIFFTLFIDGHAKKCWSYECSEKGENLN